MLRNFDMVFDHLVGSEGGYGNDPDDSGGPTKYGVTLADLRIWRRDDSLGARDVMLMGIEEAKAIFKSRYWAQVHADELPDGLDYCVSDYAYNSGTGRAIRALQGQLGVKADGIMGMVTLKACEGITDVPAFINAYQDRRQATIQTFNKFWKFGKGWTARVKEVRQTSLALYSAAHAGDEPVVAVVSAPTPVVPMRDAVVVRSPLKTAGQGSAVGVMGTTATDMAQQLAPHVSTLMILKYVFVFLTLIGVGVTMYLTVKNLNKGGAA